MERPLIFNYLDFRKYLRDFYQYKKKMKVGFSYAGFSLRAGVRSPNYLKLVIDGQRNLTAENSARFAKALELNGREHAYFEDLVAYGQAKGDATKRRILDRLIKQFKDRGASEAQTRLIRDEWEYFSDWYHCAVRELVLQPDYLEQPEWISRRLKGRVTPAQASRSLDLLVRLGFLTRNSSGRLVQSEPSVRYYSSRDEKNLLIQRYHHACGQLGLISLDRDPVERRDFSGVMLGVKSEDIPRIKAKIAEFRSQLLSEYGSDERVDDVFQVNIQVIPVT